MGGRVRQAVMRGGEPARVPDKLRGELGLDEPFADPGVGFFGLHNAVFALGDQFLEVIAPQQSDTAVDRWLARHGGDGGYMLIFQVDDIAGARARAEALGIRSVWGIDLDDICATHLHPSDMRGAIVSIDQPDPPGSWRWGGPDWEGNVGTGAPGELLGVTVTAPDPDATAARWTEVLGADPPGVRFEAGGDAVAPWRVTGPGGGDAAVDVAGVRIEFKPQSEQDAQLRSHTRGRMP